MEITLTIVLVLVVNILISLFFKVNPSSLFCGIIGMSGPSKSKFDINKLKTLFYINSLERGKDSVGYYTPKNGLKKIGEEYKDHIKKSNNILDDITPDNVFIGHVRAATVGSKTIANAHPWEYENIVGLHNGTLRNFIYTESSIGKIYGFTHTDYNVDSEILLKALDKDFNDLENNGLPALEHYEGAAALLMYNKNRDTIFACHDTERPLFYGYHGKIMYISSIEHTLSIIGCTDIKEFDVNTLYEIKNGVILNQIPYVPKSRIPTSSLTSTSSSNFAAIRFQKDTALIAGNYLDTMLIYDDETGNYKASAALKRNYSDKFHFTGILSLLFIPEIMKAFRYRTASENDINVYNWLTSTMIEIKADDVLIYQPNLEAEIKNTTYTSKIGMKIARTGEEILVNGDQINTENFMPKIGSLVRLNSTVLFVKEEELFGTEGDILLVTKYDVDNGEYVVRRLVQNDQGSTKMTATVIPKYFTIAKIGDIVEYALEHDLNDLYKRFTGDSLFEEAVEVDDDFGLEEPISKTEWKDPTEILDSDEDYDPTMIIDSDKFDEFMLNICDAVENIESKVNEKSVDIESVSTEIGELKLFLTDTKNLNFIL